MAIVFHDSIREFSEKTFAFMCANETVHAKQLSIILQLKENESAQRHALLVEVEENGDTVGVAVRMRADSTFFLGPMPRALVTSLAETLYARHITVREIQGPRELIHDFKAMWCAKTGASAEIKMEQGCYELRAVTPCEVQTGSMVRVSEDDLASVLGLVRDFVLFTDPNFPDSLKFAQSLARRHIDNGNLYAWVNSRGDYVSVAAQVRDTPTAASISLVYTSEQHRGSGYASSLVSTLSQHLLDAGKLRCNLFTDLSNPTSNAIYTRIGYRQIAECTVVEFRP